MYIVGIMSKNRKKKYFISFIEEFWVGQKPETWTGRVEIHEDGGQSTEIALSSKNREEVEALREKWDFRIYALNKFTTFLIELQGVRNDNKGRRCRSGEQSRDDA